MTERGSIVIVSGLPRSGTSMVMRMLEAGGLEVVTDRMRPPDDDNPAGYYEDERVKQLQDGHHEWLDGAVNKAVKVVSPLLEYLPPRHSYRLIFMLRAMNEILASQRRMLRRAGQEAAREDDETLGAVYESHLSRVQSWLAARANMDTLYLRYRDVMDEPEQSAVRISRFVGRALDRGAMARVVDRGLYRSRGA